MSDRLRVLEALREAGLHSHEIRRRGLSGHPSERAAELERQGYTIERRREYVGGRNGTRFFLRGEPQGAVVGVGAGVLPQQAGSRTRACADSGDCSPGQSNPAPASPGEQFALVEVPVVEPQRTDAPPAYDPFRDSEAA